MLFSTHALLVASGLLVGILALFELGRWLGRRRLSLDSENARAGLGAIEGAIFALMGLLIAFTFSGAAARFEDRRELIVQEANDVGTAWLRLDCLPADSRAPLRELLRRYLDVRLQAFNKLPDLRAVEQEFARASRLQSEIWHLAVNACQTETGRPATMLVLPALNSMFDTATRRNVALYTHPPALIFFMLTVIVLISALLAGHGMAAGRQRSWMHQLGFAMVLTATIFIILDFEMPRIGLIRIDRYDQVLQSVRDGMN